MRLQKSLRSSPPKSEEERSPMRIRKSSGSNSATPRSTRATSTIASTATKDTGGKPTLSTPEQSKGRTKKKSQSGKLTMARILTSFESVSGDYLLEPPPGNTLTSLQFRMLKKELLDHCPMTLL